MLESVLIANRGEIACRIIATCRRLGVRTVAVYSEADRGARHVRLADEAVAIGPAAAAESYLRPERIVAAARRTGAVAVHPGYGFLAESPAFARAVLEAGLAFVGPSPEAMALMGGKDTAKDTLAGAGVPLVPGYHGLGQEVERLAAEASRVGFPLLIKAVSGGGGKGMRRVDGQDDFAEALAACRREAEAAFGDGRVLLERLIERPRHVEVQIVADRHGHAVHLFERDCTLQRRHQKVMEEAPAPDLAPGIREALGRAAVQAALAARYENAGTVEFLLAPDGRFFFIEMNTRLQVEHPVTEAITGLDLVEWQLRIAAGEPLPLGQEAIRALGHAVEARLYAEDPEHGFLPSTGRLETLRLPHGMPGVRVETGVTEGDTVTPFYDPMIAKMIAHGPDRAAALDLLARALDAAAVEGPATNLAFLRRAVRATPFRALAIDTGWLDRDGAAALTASDQPTTADHALAASALVLAEAQAAAERAARSPDPTSPWHRTDGWRLNRDRERTCRFRHGGETVAVTLGEGGTGRWIEAGGVRYRAGLRELDGAAVAAELDGLVRRGWVTFGAGRLTLVRDGRTLVLELPDEASADRAAALDAGADALVTAPMPGKVTRLLAAPGDRVARGQTLAILEAMKMEHRVTAPRDGEVTAVHVQEGEQIEEGTVLLDLAAVEPLP